MGRIKTYARIKPSTHLFPHYDATSTSGHLSVSLSDIPLPDFTKLSERQAQIAAESAHRFKFSHVFDHMTSQEQVYSIVAEDIVNGFLEGYNGTIFAYGQTGSGKTYTVEGKGRLYSDRGLAPRTLSHIYDVLAERQKNEDIEIHVSYLEIYQDIGYDLLNSASRASVVVQSFPKVVVLEGPGGGVMIRNLTQHLAATESVAQNLLLQGQANRRIAETPMNQRSSRSHAVFTISMKARQHGADIYTRSKLHLVDLAGSERVSKTGVEGQQLAEAKFINLSLHHLEGVIIALQGEATSWPGNKPPSADLARIYNRHVPYRNSLLTMVLRDSLGGNCLTAMIATINLTYENLGESVSTCRFAQRVACISNAALKNEKIDDRALVRQLRKQIAQLNSEISQLKNQQELELPLAGNEAGVEGVDAVVDCADIMNRFLANHIKDPIAAGITSPAHFRECLHILKALITRHFHSSDLHPVPVILPGAAENHIKTHAVQQRTSRVSSAPVRRRRALEFEAEEKNRPAPNHANTETTRKNTDTGSPERKTNFRRIRPKSSPVKRAVDEALFKHSTASEVKVAYKSPFEQQRELQIEKLGSKVQQTQKAQHQQRHQLEKFRTDVKLQQVQLLHDELSKQIDLNKEKIAEQHAYLLLLKKGGADSHLVDQESLAQLLLQKRQYKMEARLEKVREQLDMLQSRANKMVHQVAAQNQATHQQINKYIEKAKEKQEPNQHALNETPPVDADNKPLKKLQDNLEEKYAKHVNKNGKLNSRKVFEILQKEDAKQEKKQKRLERDKILELSKQVALKETSTRLRLQEFQNLLKLSREQNNARSSHNSTEDQQSCQSSLKPRPHSSPQPVRRPVTIPTSASTVSDTDIMYLEDVADEEKAPDLYQKTHTSLYSGSQTSVKSESSQSTGTQFKPQNIKKNPTDLWESRYSFRNLSSIPSFDVPQKHNAITSGNDRQAGDMSRIQNYESSSYLSEISPEGDVKNAVNSHTNSYFDENQNKKKQTASADISNVTDINANKHLVTKPVTINSMSPITDHHYPPSRSKTFDSALSSMLEEEESQHLRNNHSKEGLDQDKASSNMESILNEYRSMIGEKYRIKEDILNPQMSVASHHPDSIETRLASYLDMDVPTVTTARSQNRGHGYHNNNTDMDVSTLLAMHKLKRLIGQSKDDNDIVRNKVTSPFITDTQSVIHTSHESDDLDRSVCRIRALPEPERETNYMSSIHEQKQRIARIRKAQKAAHVIQRTWKRFRIRQGLVDR